MNKRATDIVCYFSIVGWLIAYFASANKDESKFQLNQTLTLAIAEIALQILGYVPIVKYFVWIADIALFVFWLIGFIGACKGEDKEIPVLGKIQILK